VLTHRLEHDAEAARVRWAGPHREGMNSGTNGCPSCAPWSISPVIA
jgi:hypothetical protein